MKLCSYATLATRISQQTKSGRVRADVFFDEIQDLVEPTERPHMDVRAGPQRDKMPERTR